MLKYLAKCFVLLCVQGVPASDAHGEGRSQGDSASSSGAQAPIAAAPAVGGLASPASDAAAGLPPLPANGHAGSGLGLGLGGGESGSGNGQDRDRDRGERERERERDRDRVRDRDRDRERRREKEGDSRTRRRARETDKDSDKRSRYVVTRQGLCCQPARYSSGYLMLAVASRQSDSRFHLWYFGYLKHT